MRALKGKAAIKALSRLLILSMLFLCVSLFLPSCSQIRQFSRTDLTVFDTQTVILGYEESQEAFDKRADEILERLSDYHRLFDIYYEYDGISNLKTVNENAGVAPVKVKEPVIDLLLFSKEMYELTDGMTNVAMGSVLSLWHSYREAGTQDPENAKLPPEKELLERALHCDINDVIIDKEASTVYLADKEMSLDVGAVAKGYAVEQVALWLEESGVSGYALSVGGNVRCIGEKPKGEKWKVGVQDPDLGSDSAYYVQVMLSDGALVTSGNYQRYYTVAKKRYHHIIDPVTLMPKDEYLSVSVIAGDSGVADALSTALFNLPVEEGKAIAKKAGAEVSWVLSDNSTKMTDGFEELVD